MSREPIDDWSLEGRRSFIASRRVEARLLLDEAFTVFCDTNSLAAYGLHGDDPVEEMVQWCLDRFETASFDPARMTSSPMKLFTDVNFWLSQRVGLKPYALRRAESRRVDGGAALDAVSAPESESEDTQTSIKNALGVTLKKLRDRTCPDLVGYWLKGSRGFSQLLSGAERIEPETMRTPKERSLHVADALFRFLALHEGFVRETDPDEGRRACLETWFRPCANEPMYEIERAVVRAGWSLMASREFTQMREGGLLALLQDCVALAQASETEENRLGRRLARWSLRATLLTRFKLDDDEIWKAMNAFKQEAAR